MSRRLVAYRRPAAAAENFSSHPRNGAGRWSPRGPDALVIVDSLHFNIEFACRARRPRAIDLDPDEVSPSVWAWRPGEREPVRAYIDQVLAILPFEPAVHVELRGLAVRKQQVGHPLVERIGELRPNAENPGAGWTIRRFLSSALPGSRANEIRRLAGIFGDTIARLTAHVGAIELVIPTVPHVAAQLREAVSGWTVKPRIVVEPRQMITAFATPAPRWPRPAP